MDLKKHDKILSVDSGWSKANKSWRKATPCSETSGSESAKHQNYADKRVYKCSKCEHVLSPESKPAEKYIKSAIRHRG
jgi:hypothetical protein